jgi:glycosidase
MKYWVLEANIDGFRCDAVDFVPTDFWVQAITALKSIEGRDLILLAEGAKPENFTAGFQMNYAWDFYTNLKQIYKENKAASTIFATHQAEYNCIPAGAKKLRYTTNHDLSAWEETPMEVFNGQQGALSASVITIFTSAVPLLYSSQEVGQSELLPFFTRDPIDWSANQSMENEYEKLLSIYGSSAVFTKGSLQYFASNDIAVFKRSLEGEEFLILANVRNSQKEYALPVELQNTSWTNTADDTALSLTTSVSLDAYKYLVLKK